MTIRHATSSRHQSIGLMAALIFAFGLACACKNRRPETPLPKKTPESVAPKPTAASAPGPMTPPRPTPSNAPAAN